jgi:hypothetical protein
MHIKQPGYSLSNPAPLLSLHVLTGDQGGSQGSVWRWEGNEGNAQVSRCTGSF